MAANRASQDDSRCCDADSGGNLRTRNSLLATRSFLCALRGSSLRPLRLKACVVIGVRPSLPGFMMKCFLRDLSGLSLRPLWLKAFESDYFRLSPRNSKTREAQSRHTTPSESRRRSLLNPEPLLHQALKPRLVENVKGEFFVGEHRERRSLRSRYQF